jgi:radical SAM-linked protein
MSQENARQRLRLTVSKGNEIRFIAHLDLARTLERAFRRAELPMVYSQGFNPRPKYALASALPVGVTGREELVDIWLAPPMDPRIVARQLVDELPSGIGLSSVQAVNLSEPSLQSLARWAEYEIAPLDSIPDLDGRMAELLAQPEIVRMRHRKGKVRSYDLRPLIGSLSRLPDSRGVIAMRLAHSPQGTGRPDEVLKALDLDPARCNIERVRIIFEEDSAAPPGAA